MRSLVCTVAATLVLADPGGPLRAQSNEPQLRNELGESSSPYLRSAARQPVHWQEWSADVFALARKLDRPILLEIGAIWCHWCHEMDRESYENPRIAALINDLFVPVKVDRDLRPDIDQRYQRAVSDLNGGGGWPLLAFLTPDGNVFYGGTYMPPETLEPVARQVADGYRTDRERVAFTADSLRRRLAGVSAGPAGAVSTQIVEQVVEDIRRTFDASDGWVWQRWRRNFPRAMRSRCSSTATCRPAIGGCSTW